MKKLKLQLDALEVESFEVAKQTAEGGTVRGHDSSSSARLGCMDGCVSCYDTCNATCEYTCMCDSVEWACVTP
ncbi:MAG TPA: hypothetical protein VF541_21135 [Longimicrobium sp.]|jgi:hypothetical protein